MKALCALFRICGCSSRIFPQRSARIFAAILPNSCKTEMGRMSFTLSVHEPSSFLFGIIVITDFLQDGSVAPAVNAVLNRDTRIVVRGVSSPSTRSLMRLISTPSYPAALSFGIFLIVSRTSDGDGSLVRSCHVRLGIFLAFRSYAWFHHLGRWFPRMLFLVSFSSVPLLSIAGYFLSSFSSGPGGSGFFFRKRVPSVR